MATNALMFMASTIFIQKTIYEEETSRNIVKMIYFIGLNIMMFSVVIVSNRLTSKVINYLEDLNQQKASMISLCNNLPDAIIHL